MNENHLHLKSVSVVSFKRTRTVVRDCELQLLLARFSDSIKVRYVPIIRCPSYSFYESNLAGRVFEKKKNRMESASIKQMREGKQQKLPNSHGCTVNKIRERHVKS